MASVTERRILDASRLIAGPDKVPALRPAYVRATRRAQSQWKITNAPHVDGFSHAHRDAAIWRAPMVMGALHQMLSQVDWASCIDMPPGTGNAQLTIAQQAPLVPTRASRCSRRSLAGVRHRRGHDLFPVPAIVWTQRDLQPSWCPTKSRAARHGASWRGAAGS
jgi:hypothetical protein